MKSGFLMVLLSVCAIALGQDQKEVKELFWGKDDLAKNIVNVPEKWQNESAVIIYKNENYDFNKFGGNVTYTSSIRKRIKLLDQAAVTDFSEFSFKKNFSSSKGYYSKKQGTTELGIKIIKPDGTEKEIDVEQDAVSTDDSKKIAIANLEAGDIIDFYYHFTEPFVSFAAYGFDPVERTLGEEYPIMSMKMTFKTENDFFVNFNTYNGAPDLKELPSKGGNRRYELTASDIEKNDFPRWFYPLVELPSYKFQVYFARSGKFEEWANAYLPEKENIIKKTVSPDEVLKFYESKFVASADVDIKDFLKANTFASDEEKVKAVYYYVRHAFFTRYIEAFVVKDANIMLPFELYGSNPEFFNNERQFINYFMAFLRTQKIDYDILVATPRENGPIKDLLLEDNAKVILRVNTTNPVYLQYFSPFSNADQIAYDIEDSDAYALKISKGKKVTDIETIKLPVSTYKNNLTTQNMAVSLGADFESVNVARESSLIGHNKDNSQGDKMYFFDYVNEDYTRYGTTPLMEMVKNKKKKEQYSKEFLALINKLKDKQKEESKKETESELGFTVDDHSFEITNTGRFGKDDPFSFKEKFVVKNDLIKKAGANYVFEIGKLIGEQVDIEEKENTRTGNIYLAHPRSFSEDIVFTIPAGYTVTGLDKLNKKVENSTGGFVSSAKVEGDKLIVKTFKYYSNYYEPNKNWKNMVAFLDAAYQFTQEKVLIKKN